MDSVIKSIDSGSIMERHASRGDTIVSINGNVIHDVLDYKFFSYDPRLEIVIRTPEGKEKIVKVRKAEGEDLGLEFETYLMDKPRSCANNCVFCFIDQLPKNMRKTMYFKDDDARLSFLLGNYITMTNLSDREIQRIIDLHISPINVSVHTTNGELRKKMLGNKFADRTIEIMKRFADSGITMNCQIVCCPGLNDGEELLSTMSDLEKMWPGVNSVSIVPVGLTKFREGLYDLKPFTPEHSKETIEMVTEFSDKCLKEHGSRIFFCGDEMYLKAGLDIPDEEFYEDFTQLENGVGMLRLMETEFTSALRMADEPDGVEFSIATGHAAAPLMNKLVAMAKDKFPGLKGNVYTIDNNFFGRSITVTGLITGQDLISQLKDKNIGKRLIISDNMIRHDEKDFLDDITLEQAEKELGVKIYPTRNDGFELCDAMFGIMPEQTENKINTEETDYYKYNQN